MKTYRIRGLIQRRNPEDDPCYSFVPAVGVRVEAWDDDERLDDRIASAKTDSTGFFEMEFTDEDIRQDFLDLDLAPDLFFQVFQGRRLIGKTKPIPNLRLPVDTEDEVRLGDLEFFKEDGTVSTYRLDSALIELIASSRPEPIPQSFEESPVQVYDLLPTSTQISSGSSTALVTENRGGLQQIVEGALSEVLGRNLRTDNPKAFVSTLTQAFTPKEANGRTDYIFTPRTFAATQNDLGGKVSGAQASLYHRAKTALNDALPLLDKLYPLDPAADQQNMEAMRSIVRTEMIELVDELGTSDGPRVQRVDSLFQLLLGKSEDANNGENLGGQLKNLAEVFGLNRGYINTVDEEQNFGNFLIIRDYLVSLRGSWNAFIQESGGGAFVGTQLVLLSQSLTVVAESVQEVYRIMDLVFLSAAERQSVLIDFTQAQAPGMPTTPVAIAFPLPDGTGYRRSELSRLTPPMSVEGLLKWAWRFGSEEGPALAKMGGKLGIAKAIAETAERLMILVQAASFTPVRNTAFRREGVLRALRDLAFQLYQVKRLAVEIIPPPTGTQPDDIDPSSFSFGGERG